MRFLVHQSTVQTPCNISSKSRNTCCRSCNKGHGAANTQLLQSTVFAPPYLMMPHCKSDQPSSSRRVILGTAAAAAAALFTVDTCASWHVAAASQKVEPQLAKAFQSAMAATTYEASEAAWSRAIDLSPSNAAAWSNRGTVRLQYGHWQAAYDDLQAAAQLEQQQTGAPSAIVLNNLGNAEVALGRWSDAMQHYQAAADDGDIGSIALANYSLAAFETGDGDLAIKSARQLLRRDPEFLDSRCALTAFLWGTGRRSDAEDSWEQLQQSADGLGAALYSRATAVERVRHRWPPRATAALVAFLNLSNVGWAEGYDVTMHDYHFESYDNT